MANPFAYEEYRQKTIREKLDAERAARISVRSFLCTNRQYSFADDFSYLNLSSNL